MSAFRLLSTFVLLSFMFAADDVRGGTIPAKSCSDRDVQAAINSAADGDVVLVPSGVCTWTSAVKIDAGKGLVLMGAGIDQTIIVDDVSESTIELSTVAGKLYRVTGFTFQRGTAAKSGTGPQIIDLHGDSSAVRIDNNKFDHTNKTEPHTRSIFITQNILGVIDHNEFISGGGLNGNITIMHSRWKGVGSYGDNSWADDSHFGTNQFIFIETNTFRAPDGAHFFTTDSDAGGRFVFRYNTVINGNAPTHGTETGGRRRGVRAVEAYENTFTHNSRGNLGLLRSGTAVFFNNVANGFKNIWVPTNMRSTNSYGTWKACDGANAFDVNDGVVYESGTHDGGTSDSLIDSTKQWTPDQWTEQGFSVHNISQDRGGYVTSNTSNQISLGPVGAGNKAPRFEPGDSYQILRATICMDGPGSGKGSLLSGVEPTANGTVSQVRDPIYQWNNIVNGQVYSYDAFNNPHIVLGRDVINEVKPEYTPYIYPHPLADSSFDGLPSPPRNLRIRSSGN